MAFTTQIIKTQIKRFYSHELVEYDKNADPRSREDSEDKVCEIFYSLKVD